MATGQTQPVNDWKTVNDWKNVDDWQPVASSSQDKLQQAIATLKAYNSTHPTTQFEQNIANAPTVGSEVMGGVKRFGQGALQAMTPQGDLDKTMTTLVGPAWLAAKQVIGAGKGMYNAAQSEATSQQQGENRAGNFLAGAENAPIIGGMVKYAEQGAARPTPGQGLGTEPVYGTPQAFGAATEGSMMAASPEIAKRLALKAIESPSPISKNTAVENVTNAVNPDIAEMPKMRQNLNSHLDDVLQFAKENKLPVKSVSDLASATQQAGNVAHDYYYKNLFEPVADVSVKVDPKLYQGRQYAGEATLRSLDNRLTEINNTLYPKYQKGGVAGQAAVGAEQSAQLRAEGAYLRDTINNTIAKNLDMQPESVAAARQKMGVLRQMGEDIQYYADKNLHDSNALVNKGIPTDAHPTSYLAKRLQMSYRNRFGNPADKRIASVAEKYKPGESVQEQPTVLDRLYPQMKANPMWQQQGIEAGRGDFLNPTYVLPDPSFY